MEQPSELRNWATSMVRTIVAPGIVALLATWATLVKVSLPGDVVPTVVSGIGFTYWLGVRLLERRFPGAGWLLLVPRPPSYGTEEIAALKRSAIRTFVPLVVGAFAALAAQAGFNIDSRTLIAFATTAFSGTYYSAVRGAELSRPAAGKLLGAVGAPGYDAPCDKDGGC